MKNNALVSENSFFFRQICVNITIGHLFYNLIAVYEITGFSMEWERAMMRLLELELGPAARDTPASHLAMTCQVPPFAAK